MKATRSLTFEYAHRLVNHEGQCRNLHGHHAHVEITVAASELDAVGRVLDFGEIKRLVGGWIDQFLDHTFIANEIDIELIQVVSKVNPKPVFIVPFETTSENLAQLIRGVARRLLEGKATVSKVRFYETPNGSATSEDTDLLCFLSKQDWKRMLEGGFKIPPEGSYLQG